MAKDITILFDLDGTLIDSTDAIVNGFQKAFREHKASQPTRAEICKLVGHPLEYMFGSLGVSSDLVADYIKIYKASYQENYLAQTTLLPRAYDSIKLASQFANLAVVTTKTSLYSKILLDHLEILSYFDVVIGRDDVQNPKPNPEPILKAIKSIDKKADKIYMIGDTPMDANAAKSANVISIGVYCGYDTKESLECVCDFVYSDALEAVKFIQTQI